LLNSVEKIILELNPYDKEFKIIESGGTEYYQFYINNEQEQPFLKVYEETAKLLIVDHEGDKYLMPKINKFKFQ